MDGLSLDITAELLSQLKQLLPDAFSEGKVDITRLKAALEAADALAPPTEHYELTWAGKADARREVQRQTAATLVPDRARSVDFDTTGNVFIEGENLEVLRVLQRAYFGKVKMIYIDPPYNTGSDSFVYPDDYTERREDYEKRSGKRDENGFLNKQDLWKKNSKESGQYHSAWLSMMWPRLYLSRNLLREDGVIFVSIDDNEAHNLKLIMDEVFGSENFLASFLWKKKGTTTNVDGATVSSLTEYVLCYTKNKSKGNINYRIVSKETRKYPLTDEEGNYRTTVLEKKNSGDYERDTMLFEILGQKPREGKRWQIGEETARGLEKKGRFIIDEGIVKLKIYDFEDKDTSSANPNLLFEHGSTDSGTKDVEGLFGKAGLFDNPKPKELLMKLIQLTESEDKNDIILDFFAGSGSTAQAVMELNFIDKGNRHFVLIQIPELVEEKTAAYKASYRTISDITQARITKAAANLRAAEVSKLALDGATAQDFGFRTYKLEYSNFKPWQGDVRTADSVLTQLELFQEPLRDYSDAASAAMLTELLLKAGLPLSARAIVADVAGVPVHQVPGTDTESRGLWLALTAISPAVVAAAVAARPTRLVVPGRLFGTTDADQTVSNYRLQLDDAGVKLQLI